MSHFSRHARALASPGWLPEPRFSRVWQQSHRQIPPIRRLAGHNYLPRRPVGFQGEELEHRRLPDTPAIAMLVIILLGLACFLITLPFARK